jgi:hypothetical protein
VNKFRKLLILFFCVAYLYNNAYSQDTDSSLTDKVASELSWPSPFNSKNEWSEKALNFSLNNDSYRFYLCVPYSYWVFSKPFVAIDSFDPFTPPEYAIIKLPSNNNLLIFIVLLNVMFIIAIIKLSNEKNLVSFVKSLYSNVSAVKYYGNRGKLFSKVNLQLLFVQLLMVSLGIALYKNVPIPLPDDTLLRFIILFLSLLVVMILKIFVNWAIEKIFEINNLAVVVINHTIGINFVSTLVILPVFLVVYLNSGVSNDHFLPVFTTATIIISLFIRVFRSFMMLNLSFPYPKVYLLLYFCTAEILPWLILFKLIAY